MRTLTYIVVDCLHIVSIFSERSNDVVDPCTGTGATKSTWQSHRGRYSDGGAPKTIANQRMDHVFVIFGSETIHLFRVMFQSVGHSQKIRVEVFMDVSFWMFHNGLCVGHHQKDRVS